MILQRWHDALGYNGSGTAELVQEACRSGLRVLVGIAGSAEALGGMAGRNPAAQIWHQGQTSLGLAMGREGNALRCICMRKEESRGGGGGGKGEKAAMRRNKEGERVRGVYVCWGGREGGSGGREAADEEELRRKGKSKRMEG